MYAEKPSAVILATPAYLKLVEVVWLVVMGTSMDIVGGEKSTLT